MQGNAELVLVLLRNPGTTDQLAAAMWHQLDRIQRRPTLIAGFLGQTGLTLQPQPP